MGLQKLLNGNEWDLIKGTTYTPFHFPSPPLQFRLGGSRERKNILENEKDSLAIYRKGENTHNYLLFQTIAKR